MELPELRLENYRLSPQLTRRGEARELQGRLMPSVMLPTVSLVLLIMMGSRWLCSRTGEQGRVVLVATVVTCILVLIVQLALLLTRVRVAFDPDRRAVTVTRSWLGLWSRTDSFDFDAFASLDAVSMQPPYNKNLLLQSGARTAILGRFRPAPGVVPLKRELRALVFGTDPIEQALADA